MQTIYYPSAYDSISVAFVDGGHRYFTIDGLPMRLEVPCDQYGEFIELM